VCRSEEEERVYLSFSHPAQHGVSAADQGHLPSEWLLTPMLSMTCKKADARLQILPIACPHWSAWTK